MIGAGKERLEKYGPGGRGSKLGFVYMSGTWAHGSSHYSVNDLEPVGMGGVKVDLLQLLAWRVQMERDMLAVTDVLDVVVVRPALMYG